MGFVDDKELNEYRNIMQPPDVTEYRDGFNWKTVIGALFLGFIMMPASKYLALVIGPNATVGSAARWVTIILFAEISKRSFKDLKMQELYTLHYMTGLALASPFQGYLWKQYVVQSEFVQAMGIAQELPSWAFPSAASLAEHGPTFFTSAWVPVIALTMFGVIISKVDNYGLGYVLYRLVNDVEKLPFPFAPVNAAGIVALSGARDEKQSWRWRCFAIGGVIGLVWGALYVAVPIITQAILPKRLELIPLVYVDFTPYLSTFLPAVPLNLVFNLGTFLAGMMAPFWSVMGGFVGLVVTMIANPFLYKAGILSNWKPEMGFVDTMFINNIDFYMSFGIGLTLAVTVSSFGILFRYLFKSRAEKKEATPLARSKDWLGRFTSGWKTLVTNNRARGDFSIFVAIGIYLASTFSWIVLGCFLIQGYPVWIFVFYALVYTPLISYATAKLEGLCGRAIDIPYLKQLTVIMSGHKGVDIWFAPMPIQNLGKETVGFRVLDLTGTKIKSQIKALLLTTPIVVIASLITSQILWQMAPVPSDAYPFTQKMWELNVKNWCIRLTATQEGGSLFMEALNGSYILWGLGLGTAVFAGLSAFGLPVMLIYGAVWGLGQSSPGALIWMMCGAFVGKFYFKRKFKDMWLKYMAVILAGFGCGMGLISMVAMAFTIMTKILRPMMF